MTGITQYVTEQAEKYFSSIDEYEIHIKDGNNARALITKTKDDKNRKFIFIKTKEMLIKETPNEGVFL